MHRWALILAAHGCSWAFVDRLPKTAPPSSPQLACDDDSRWPLVDGTIALVSYGLMITGIATASSKDLPESVRGASAITALASIPIGVTFAYSSRAGERRVERCALLRRGVVP